MLIYLWFSQNPWKRTFFKKIKMQVNLNKEDRQQKHLEKQQAKGRITHLVDKKMLNPQLAEEGTASVS
jgi:hypothetical protein